jgi:hypothetical protein
MRSLVLRRSMQIAQPDRRLSTEVADAERPGVVAAAGINGGAFAASVALHNAAMLSRTADTAFKISPMGEDIYRSILMAYGDFATTEIRRLGFQDRR